jgi:hypothetical protein
MFNKPFANKIFKAGDPGFDSRPKRVFSRSAIVEDGENSEKLSHGIFVMYYFLFLKLLRH